jgi:SsrA-binding protein
LAFKIPYSSRWPEWGLFFRRKTMAVKIVTENRKARHEYHILETFEAGLVLTGTEVKSLRAGKANLQDSYARVDNGELMLYNMHISPYEQGNRFNLEPKRIRKLLMHKQEIMRLLGKTREKGLALIPLKVYFKNGLAKVDLALAKGKKLYDRRDDAAERDAKREIDRAVKERFKTY